MSQIVKHLHKAFVGLDELFPGSTGKIFQQFYALIIFEASAFAMRQIFLIVGSFMKYRP